MKELPSVILRAMEPEDLDLLYTIENDQQLWNIGVTSVPYSRFVLHDYIANTRNDIYSDGQVRLMIEDKSRGVVGIADLINFDPKNNKAELGLVIMSQFRGQGYATAALHNLEHYAATILHLHQLYVIIAAANTSALQLFRKEGYHETSHLREWLFNGKKYEDAVLLQTFL